MREGWTYKKLGDIATLINGDRGKNYPSTDDFINVGIPFINAGHIQNGEVDFSEMNYISEQKFDSLRSGKVNNGDILFCLRGSLGKSALVNIDYGAIASSLVIIRPHSDNSHFIQYYLQSNKVKELIQKNNNGSSQPNLSATSVASFSIPVPPLSEQQRIVNELDLQSNIIEKKKAQLKEYDQLAQSIFYDMFGDPVSNEKGWDVKKLVDCCKNCDSQRKPITAKDRIKGTIPYYGASGVVDFVKDYIFDGEYLLISEDGANLIIRSTPIAFRIKGKTWVNNHAHVLQFDALFKQIFMEYSINLRDISSIVTGCAQPKLTQAAMNNINIPYPPLTLQQSFASKIEAIEQQKALVQQSITEAETLFNSRMDYYFN